MQAPLSERCAVYDALLAKQASGNGALSAHVEEMQDARTGPSGSELTTCNIYFVLPQIDRDVLAARERFAPAMAALLGH